MEIRFNIELTEDEEKSFLALCRNADRTPNQYCRAMIYGVSLNNSIHHSDIGGCREPEVESDGSS
jgi:hypothetical protein